MGRAAEGPRRGGGGAGVISWDSETALRNSYSGHTYQESVGPKPERRPSVPYPTPEAALNTNEERRPPARSPCTERKRIVNT